MISITSPQNDRIKDMVRLRKRGPRDKAGMLLVEGFREVRAALANGIRPLSLYVCPDLFQGSNEPELIRQCQTLGADLFTCSEAVFRKIAYRDRPDGLLLLAPQIRCHLTALALPETPLLLVCERIEKPGNLGTMLRSADAAGVDAVIVCDPCTDINNPNTVRASVGALFTRPVVTADRDEAMAWLRTNGIRIVAATPSADLLHTEADLTGALALTVGAEQFGLTEAWIKESDIQVRIPMKGQCDSLNVAAAATILLFEAVRQRMSAGRRPDGPG